MKLNRNGSKLAATIGTAGELRGLSQCSRFSTILRLIVFPHRFVSREVLWHLDGIGPSCLADLQMPLPDAALSRIVREGSSWSP